MIPRETLRQFLDRRERQLIAMSYVADAEVEALKYELAAVRHAMEALPSDDALVGSATVSAS